MSRSQIVLIRFAGSVRLCFVVSSSAGRGAHVSRHVCQKGGALQLRDGPHFFSHAETHRRFSRITAPSILQGRNSPRQRAESLFVTGPNLSSRFASQSRTVTLLVTGPIHSQSWINSSHLAGPICFAEQSCPRRRRRRRIHIRPSFAHYPDRD